MWAIGSPWTDASQRTRYGPAMEFDILSFELSPYRVIAPRWRRSAPVSRSRICRRDGGGGVSPWGTRTVLDVDLRFYVAETAVDRTVRAIPALAASCGTVIASFSGEHVGAPALTIVLYDDLVHVDFDVLSSAAAGEHNAGLPVLVLWDRDGVSARLEDDRPRRRG